VKELFIRVKGPGIEVVCSVTYKEKVIFLLINYLRTLDSQILEKLSFLE